MDEEIIICRCQEITKAQVIQAIRDGARTIDGVKRRTRTGMGLCQGKTCQRLVAQIISEECGIPLDELLPSTFRAPVRPINISIILDGED